MEPINTASDPSGYIGSQASLVVLLQSPHQKSFEGAVPATAAACSTHPYGIFYGIIVMKYHG